MVRVSEVKSWRQQTVDLLGRASPVAVLNLAFSLPANALNNPIGTSDPSVADFDVSITVPTMFRIGGIASLAFGAYSGSGAMALDDDGCVWTNADNGSGTYKVTARGDGTSFAFTVVKTADSSKVIPYTVRWNTTSGTSGNQALTTNVASANKTGANTISSDC